MRRTLLLTTVLVVALCGAAATGVSAQETVKEYNLTDDYDDIDLDDGDTVRLELDNVGGNITLYNDSDTSNASVLLSTTETGEYETNENVSWADESPDYVEFTVTGNLSDDLDGGWYETDGDAAGTIAVSSGLLPPIGGDEAAQVLGVPIMMALFGVIGFVVVVALLIAIARAV